MVSNIRLGLRFPFTLFCSVFLATCMSLLIFLSAWAPASAQGTILYGAAHTQPNGPSTLYRIDIATGLATRVGAISFNHCGGLDFDAEGKLYGTAQLNDEDNVLISVDPFTGEGTEIGPIAFPNGIFDVSLRNSDGLLFVSYLDPDENNCVTLGTINTHTGAGTRVGSIQSCNPGNGLAFSPADTLFLAQTTFGTTNGNLYTLDQATGIATLVCPLHFPENIEFPRINAMDFHPLTGVLYASLTTEVGIGAPKYLSTVNTTTGEVTIIGETIDGLAALAFYPPAVNRVPAYSDAGIFIMVGGFAVLIGMLLIWR